MFDAPVDVWYLWIGVAIASVAVLGIVGGLPRSAPPDAVRVANHVDAVATSPPGSVARVAVDAAEVRVRPDRIGLRGGGGSTEATVAYGPATAALDDERLARILEGTPPSSAFDSPAAFDVATRTAREPPRSWRPTAGEIVVRRVAWEDVDVTLVG